ncbi:MAG: ROK family glucokinase [Acidimicrobiia bacterium]|nr:MAG: ROK family glucokinase [Acidimicrobiia bacterium]
MISIGIDIGGTKALAVRMDASETVAESQFEVDRSTGTIDAIMASIDSVYGEAVDAIGVGVAGLVNHKDGTLVWGPHVPGTNLDVRTAISDRFGVPVYVDNDANTASFAELRVGAAKGYRNVLFVTLGTGIGGAVIIDGVLYRGGGFAGEWGHVQVDRDGLLCDCGKRGCWETRASGPAMVRLAHQVVTTNPDSSLARILGSNSITGESVVAAADAGDETARALVTEVGRSFGQGLAGLVAIFDPELIVVGGGLGSIGESIVGPARRVLSDSLHGGKLRVPPAVQVATLGPAAGAVGAALLAAEEGG